MLPDLAKFHHFGKYLKIFGNIFKVYLVLGKVFNSLWHNLYACEQIVIGVNGQILKTQSGHLVTRDPHLFEEFHNFILRPDFVGDVYGEDVSVGPEGHIS